MNLPHKYFYFVTEGVGLLRKQVWSFLAIFFFLALAPLPFHFLPCNDIAKRSLPDAGLLTLNVPDSRMQEINFFQSYKLCYSCPKWTRRARNHQEGKEMQQDSLLEALEGGWSF